MGQSRWGIYPMLLAFLLSLGILRATPAIIEFSYPNRQTYIEEEVSDDE